MMGIWCVALWQQLGQPARLRLVELGPGRGTLMADLLRGTAPFAACASALEVARVEVSPVLQRLQFQALKCNEDGGSGRDDSGRSSSGGATESGEADASRPPGEAASPQSGRSGLGAGPRVTWHRSLDEVASPGGGGGSGDSGGPGSDGSPEGAAPTPVPTIYIGHEFLDALPVHQFTLTGEKGGGDGFP